MRVSVTVVYPNPGQVRQREGDADADAQQGARVDTTELRLRRPRRARDPRFVYDYAAVPQKIVLGNAQDDPGLFLTAITNNLSDQRYLPFENAGAISSWHLEMPAANNEIDLTAVGDVVLHLYYTALSDDGLKGIVQQKNAADQPAVGVRVFSARNDFGAAWDVFLAPPPGADQAMLLSVNPSMFPPWTRGKTITVVGLAVLAIGGKPAGFVLQPQVPLDQGPSEVTMAKLLGTARPAAFSAMLTVPSGTQPGQPWGFKLRASSAGDFKSLQATDLGDLVLLVAFTVS